MKSKFYLYTVLIWFILLTLQSMVSHVSNVLILELGDPLGRVVGDGITILLIYGGAYYFISRIEITAYFYLWIIGGMWLAFTILFEFGYGSFVAKISIEQLIHDHYDITQGKIGIFILIAFLVSPFLAGKIMKKELEKENHTLPGKK